MKTNRLPILTLCLLVLIVSQLKAQDKYYTLFFQNPLYLNPAFAGIEEGKLKFNANGRFENYSISESFRYTISSDISVGKSGIGIQFASNNLYDGSLIDKSLTASYTYNWVITENFTIRPALQLGIVAERIDFAKFIFQDQYISSITPGIHGEQFPKDDKLYGKAGLGLIFVFYDLTAGLTVDNINRPNSLLYSETHDGMGLNYTAHFQYKFSFNVNTELKPGLIFRRFESQEHAYIEPSLLLRINKIELGTLWRLREGSVKTIAGLIGYSCKVFSIYYSYDHNSGRRYYGGNAHELALGVKIAQ